MVTYQQDNDPKGFILKRSQLTTDKLFVEYYLPEYQALLEKLRQGPYPLRELKEISSRMFTGPFGSNRTVDMYRESGIPYVRVKDVLPDRIEPSGLTYITPEKHQSLIASRVVPGDVLLTIAGRLGTAAVFPPELNEGNITGHIAGIEPQEGINPYYLAIFLNSTFGEFQVKRLGHRTTRPELNLQEVGRILVSVPSLEAQDNIVQLMNRAYAVENQMLSQAYRFLSGIEAYILDILDIPNSSFEDARHFTVKRSLLDRADVRYFAPFYLELEKLLELGKYETQTLDRLCTYITNGRTPSHDSYTNDGYPIIKVASLTHDRRIDWSRVAFVPENFFQKSKKAQVEDGDVLLLSASHQLDYIGQSFGFIDNVPTSFKNRCIAVGELIIVRPDTTLILPQYLLASFMLKPVQHLVNRMTRGQSAHLYAEDLKNLRIPLPPLEIQEAIVRELNQRRDDAQKFRVDAKKVVAEAKSKVDRMILGEEAAV